MRAVGVLDRGVARYPRGGRHVIYVDGEANAAAVAGTLEREGWETSVHPTDDAWLVVAGCLRVVTRQMARENRARLEALALAHDGQYDGWESAAP